MSAMPQPAKVHYPTDILPPFNRLTFRLAQEAKTLQRLNIFLSCCRESSGVRVEREDIALWSGCAVQGEFIGRYVSREVLRIRLVQQLQLDGGPGMGKTVRGQAGWFGPSGAVQGVFGVVQM